MSLVPFEYGGQQVRIIEIEGEPWFVLADLCAVLEIKNSRDVSNRLDADMKGVAPIDTLGGTQQMVVVNESGMYQTILRSDKPEAKLFRRWITSEVLPSIRKTGQYGTRALDLSSLDSISAILDAGKAALNRAQEAERRALALEGPAAQAQTMREADGLRTISDLVNDLKVHAQSNYPGVKILPDHVFDLAGRCGLIIRGNTVRHNQPTSKAIEAGWVKPKNHEYQTKNHGARTTYYARLTPRGYARLWDAAIANLRTYGQVLAPRKEIA